MEHGRADSFAYRCCVSGDFRAHGSGFRRRRARHRLVVYGITQPVLRREHRNGKSNSD